METNYVLNKKILIAIAIALAVVILWQTQAYGQTDGITKITEGVTEMNDKMKNFWKIIAISIWIIFGFGAGIAGGVAIASFMNGDRPGSALLGKFAGGMLGFCGLIYLIDRLCFQ